MSMNQQDYSSIPICERCKLEKSIFNCQECSPFHFFCQRCDTIVHNSQHKFRHSRKNLLNENLPSNVNSFDKNNFISNSPLVYSTDYSTINGIIPNAISNLNKNVDNSTVYSREYVLNLQKSFENEKSELLYKINFLQNNLERIKSSFGREMLRLQNEQSEEFKKNQVKENEMNFKFNSIISEKNEKLNKLNEENLNLKNINNNLNNKLEDFNSNNLKNQNAFNNKLNNLNNEIKNLQNEKNIMQKDHINRINEIIKNNTKEIKEIEEKNQKKLDDIYYDGLYKEDK